MNTKSVLAFTDIDPAALASHMPSWFPKLYHGCVFGKRKDKLVREIIELGGMALLESKCGMRFLDQGDHPNCNPTVGVLTSIKEELKETQVEATGMMQRKGKYTVISKGGGAVCAIFVPDNKLKGKMGK
jgi:hypothetical protein